MQPDDSFTRLVRAHDACVWGLSLRFEAGFENNFFQTPVFDLLESLR
jgi:hypothetical protein